MFRVLWFLFWLWVAINLIGKEFDDYCIIGRISEAQAYAINRTEWEKHPSDARDAQAGDRILNRECSEISRRFFRVLR